MIGKRRSFLREQLTLNSSHRASSSPLSKPTDFSNQIRKNEVIKNVLIVPRVARNLKNLLNLQNLAKLHLCSRRREMELIKRNFLLIIMEILILMKSWANCLFSRITSFGNFNSIIFGFCSATCVSGGQPYNRITVLYNAADHAMNYFSKQFISIKKCCSISLFKYFAY